MVGPLSAAYLINNDTYWGIGTHIFLQGRGGRHLDGIAES